MLDRLLIGGDVLSNVRLVERDYTGLGSARRVREFYYHPDDIKKLAVGKGIFMSKDSYFHSYININKPF